MTSVSLSSELEISADDVYNWLAYSADKELVASDDLEVITKAFMKARGDGFIAVYLGHEKLQPIVKKAMAAFSFINIGNALRRDPEMTGNPLKGRVISTFARSKISQLFNTRVGPDRELLMPGYDDIEFFSRAWGQVMAKYSDTDASKMMAWIREHTDPEETFIFPKAVGLFKLGRDPKLKSIPPARWRKFIETNYPELANVFHLPICEVVERIREDGGKNFPGCIQGCVKDKHIIKGVLLIKAAHEFAMTNPSTVMHNIKLINNRWKSIQDLFSPYSPDQLESILKNLHTELADIELMGQLIIFGHALEHAKTAIYSLDEANYSLLTPLQSQLWDQGDFVVKKAGSVLQRFIEQSLQGERDLTGLNVNEKVQPYIADRDENHVTSQFKKDGHRYEQLILVSLGKPAILLPGNNTHKEAVPFLKDQLKAFATIGDHFNPSLFATLQESVCQNIEKPATEQWIRQELQKAFKVDNLHAFIPVAWRKTCICLEQVDDTHFKAAHEYKAVILNPSNSEKKELRVRIVFPIGPGETSGSWVIGDPYRKQISGPDADSELIRINNPIPLASLTVLEEPVAKPAEVVISEDESDFDFDTFNAAQSASR